MGAREQLLQVYATASGGDPEAYAWLIAWHGWVHAIDDFVDEPNHAPAEVVDLCAEGAVLFSSGFYRRHAEALGPMVAVIAAEYSSSIMAPKALADVLRIAGNHIVLVVAYLKGGRPLVRVVSQALWPIVHATQLEAAA